MPLYLEGRSAAVAGRRLTITREKPFVIRTRTTNHEGEVQVMFGEGSYRLDNRSPMRCRINGLEQRQAALANGDELEIGKDRFQVVIERDTQSIPATPQKHDIQDDHDTQALARVSVDLSPEDSVEPPVVCSVCDARIVVVASRGQTWSDGDRHICARCLEKGVKPDHLPRPFMSPPMTAITPTLGNPVLPSARPETPVPATRSVAANHNLVELGNLASDSTTDLKANAVSEAAAKESSPAQSGDSDRQRNSRRISASRLTAVEPAQREGLLSRVGKVFGRRDERHQRLADLEADREVLLAEVGRHALGPGGGLGLPEKAVAALLGGGSVTLASADLSQTDLERWRAQRQRMILLDAEIAALRKALGLGSDPQMHQQSSPTLRPDQKAMQDRAFATLDGLSTDELSRPDPQAIAGAVATPARSTTSGRQRPVPAARRRR